MTVDTGDAVVLAPDGGRVITGGAVNARLLVAHDHPSFASTFEMTVAPGFDVGAHVHDNGEEMFYVVDGELDVLCFEPLDRAPADWHAWTDSTGHRFLRGQPGAFMYVPAGIPHAFANPTSRPATIFFQSSVAGGHENYFAELGALLSHASGRPDPGAVQQLEARYGTEQLTSMRAYRPSRSLPAHIPTAAAQQETASKHMSDDKVFAPSYPYEAGLAHGMLSPFEPGTRMLPARYRIDPKFRSITTDIVFEKDIPVTLRDGVTIYADIFRPAGTDKVPVIVAWSPYGKSEGTAPSVTGIFDLVGLDNGALSGLEKFEGPDPAYWCAQGYAICNPDARGIGESEGDSVVWDRQEGQDCHDLIEWLADQDWCTGKVAMSGTSYLAVSQWFTAAEQPPHLTAINPWEGVSDVYRDLAMRGGMPDLGFTDMLQHKLAGKNRREDVVAEAERYPLMNDLWTDKIPRLDRITVPAYVVASYSHTLHTEGTFRAWRRIASDEKWLRIHASLEWPDYYDSANVEDLRRFFDHYLKGEDNGWEQTPRVRFPVLDLEGGDRTGLTAGQFPPDGVTDTKYYLDGRTRSLSPEVAPAAAIASYDAATLPGQVSFTVRFDEETTLVGYLKAHLWVETSDADDADLFLLVEKLTANGTPLRQFNTPNQGAMIQDATERSGSVLRYKGSPGRLRVSMRHLDETMSTDTVPEHTFDRIEKLQPGQVVDVEIDLFPIGLVFHPGEQLRLMISARNPLGGIFPGNDFYNGQPDGRLIVHTGGPQASYLNLPVISP